MRFMVIVKATKESEAGIQPGDEKMFEAMGKFNEELVKAGVMLRARGCTELEGRAHQVRWRQEDRDRWSVRGDEGAGPGFWLLQTKTKEECIEWIKRAPFINEEIEIRQVYETEEFAVADPTGELRAQEQRLRDAARSVEART
jgi:hypothetical protein